MKLTGAQFKALKDWINAEIQEHNTVSIEGELYKLAVEQEAYKLLVEED